MNAQMHPRPGALAPLALRKQLGVLIGDRRRLIVALALTSIVSGISEAGTLAISAQIAATLVNGHTKVHTHLGPFSLHSSIPTLLWVAFGLCILRLFLQLPMTVLPARIASDVQAGVRMRLFDAYTRASWPVQASEREGKLQEVMTSQVLQAASAALQMTTLISSSLTFLVLLSAGFVLNALAAVGVLVVAVAAFAIIRPLRGRGKWRSRMLSRAQVRFAEGVAEAIRLAEETHVFGAGAAQRKRIEGLVNTSRDLLFRAQVLLKLAPNVYQSMVYLLLVAGLAALYLLGRSHAASLAGVVLLLVRASSSGQSVQTSYQALVQATPFIQRTQRTEQRYRDSAPVYGDRPLERVETLAFRDVSYAYRPDRPALSSVSFEVDASEAVGVVGPSGAGKSTLVQLLLALRPPDSGEYLVNGVPPQAPRLLHATVAENIRFFRADLDDATVERAARLARIHDDVMSWAKGYDTIVGPRADAVSGGQQQRICLARALVGSPEVLVLDEPTSALDPHSEKLIGDSLAALQHELTLFIIAHRMSTLDMCDRVMVILGGKLVAFESKELLQEQNAYYRQAWQLAAGAPEGMLP
jgi:ABC-type multidrug transport system fused ATPase/permease subunit